eukprot:5397817-Pleurochrysis_carterae.AAC.3
MTWVLDVVALCRLAGFAALFITVQLEQIIHVTELCIRSSCLHAHCWESSKRKFSVLAYSFVIAAAQMSCCCQLHKRSYGSHRIEAIADTMRMTRSIGFAD